MRQTLALTAFLALAACGKSDNDPGPGGVTVGEAKALDQAAEMIEQRRLSAGAPARRMPSPTAAASSPAP
jgi:hypothetical protein